MTTADQLIDTDVFGRNSESFDFDLTSEINEAHYIKPAQAQVLSYRKSKGNLVHNGSQSQINLPPSPADSMMSDKHQRPISSLDAKNPERDRLTHAVDGGSPDRMIPYKTPEHKDLLRRRSQYYSDVFASREPIASARERVIKESIVMAEIRTNVIICDEYTFITDLSHHLSSRYQRPESSIMITVQHSACLLFAGSFEPAYTLTITALPTLVQPATNRRNAALIQQSLEEAISVPPTRGMIRFIPLPEENYANNGQTYAGEIDELERQNSQELKKEGHSRPGSKAGNRSHKKRNSMRSLKNLRSAFGSKENLALPSPTYSESTNRQPPPLPTTHNEMDKKAARVQAMPRRKSFLGLFSSRKENS